MSDLAKKCADGLRSEAALNAAFEESEKQAQNKALAAFIEAAQALRDHKTQPRSILGAAYDAALRDLAQSMEVE